jgi:L-malate glycosyltransferase
MIICYIANSESSHTDKWVKPFVEKGHEIHIISHSKREIEGTTLHYVDYSVKNFFLKAHKVHEIIRKINPNILHAQQVNTCGLYAASMGGYNLISSGWGSDVLVAPFESKLMNFIVKYVIEKSTAITSGADYMTERLIELGADSSKIYKVPLGVFENIFEYRHKYNTQPRLDFISLRRHEPIYNMDILIKGFNEALKTNKNLYLTVGAFGAQTEELMKMVEDFKICDNVKFTGKYNPQDIGSIFEKYDGFISIPKSDSTSVSVLEGMAVGVFPVLSNLPANREWIKDKENGIIIKETTPEMVRDGILWCAENKAELRAASDINVKLVKEKAVWRDSVKIVEDLYEKYKK